MKRMKKISMFLVGSVVCLSFLQFKKAEPVTSTTEDPRKIYTEKCASCHGEKVEAFVDRKWKHGTKREELIASITNGYSDFGMPAWEGVVAEKDIAAIADLIVESLKTVSQYDFTKEKKKSDGPAIFKSTGMTVVLDTIASGLSSPWGFEQLPDMTYLITDRSGTLYHIDKNKNKTAIKGTPEVVAEGQGGMLDITIHPKYAENGWVYISYSKGKTIDGKKLATTAVVRGKIKGDQFMDSQEVFEALPYAPTKHHYGSRLVFDKKGYLFISMGERGMEKVFPQDITTAPGKIHRINDDGSIPKDNPFLATDNAVTSAYTMGNRNPQGMTMDPITGLIWETEHGPRGGDELNIIKAGTNYGWPVISYGINYDGKPITPISKKEGMAQPVTYWIPSIAPSGLAFVSGDKYPAWKGSLLVGSLRFNHIARCTMKDNKVVSQEKILLNVGRTRNVEMGKDGYIYVSIEGPGTVFRLKPM
jgi:glucose/arabinose dehydrogenase